MPGRLPAYVDDIVRAAPTTLLLVDLLGIVPAETTPAAIQGRPIPEAGLIFAFEAKATSPRVPDEMLLALSRRSHIDTFENTSVAQRRP